MAQKVDPKVSKRLESINHKILILSGKGGVGKSTIAVNFATALALSGKKVGLLDIDMHGPSIPKLLGVEGRPLHGTEEEIIPLQAGENLTVMSIGFMLRKSEDAVIWRGPMKYNVIKQFLGDVKWGDLDYLIVDSPPGTGDEPLTIAQLVGTDSRAVVVTTPQDVSISDVKKCVTFCNQLSVEVLGVVENMSGFVCPHCGKKTDIFKRGGGEKMAADMEIPFLGRVPLDPEVVNSSDSGKAFVSNFPHTETGKIFSSLVAPLLRLDNEESSVVAGGESGTGAKNKAETEKGDQYSGKVKVAEAEGGGKQNSSDNITTIALPVVNGKVCDHFGHCQHFAMVDADMNEKKIVKTEFVDSPGHQPGLLPRWLHERGAEVVIAGGMGSRARNIFNQNGIEVVVGAGGGKPEDIVRDYLEGTLETGDNICDH